MMRTGNAGSTILRSLPGSWRGAVAFGTLGGVTLTAMELLLLPSDLTSSELGELALRILPQWTVTGIAISGLATFAEHRLRASHWVLALFPFAIAMSTVFTGLRALTRRFDLMPGLRAFAGRALEWPTFLYDLWVILFFGGLFLIACVLRVRAERTRKLLIQSEIKRGRTETNLDQAQLRTLQAQVDPAFLLRVMGDVARRYEADHAGADRLLDDLILFLRQAMPGVRAGWSTLDDEIALAAAYGQVWEELEPMRARWRVRIDTPLPNLPFPSFLLLPVLDRWAGAAVPGSNAELRVASRGDVVTMKLVDGGGGPVDWIGSELECRLRAGLRAAFGEKCVVTMDRNPSATASLLSLRVPLSVASGGERSSMPPTPIVNAVRGPVA